MNPEQRGALTVNASVENKKQKRTASSRHYDCLRAIMIRVITSRREPRLWLLSIDCGCRVLMTPEQVRLGRSVLWISSACHGSGRNEVRFWRHTSSLFGATRLVQLMFGGEHDGGHLYR